MADLRTTELDLHAFIDGRLGDGRRREVATYLDAHPDAAERVAAYAQQRDALALLGRCLAPEPSPARLAGLVAAVLVAARRARRGLARGAAPRGGTAGLRGPAAGRDCRCRVPGRRRLDGLGTGGEGGDPGL